MGVPIVVVDFCEPRPFSATYLLIVFLVLIGSLYCRRGQCKLAYTTEIYAASSLVLVAFTIVTVGIIPTRLPRSLERLPCLRVGLAQDGRDFVIPKTDAETDPLLILDHPTPDKAAP